MVISTGRVNEAKAAYEKAVELARSHPTTDFNSQKIQSFYGLATCYNTLNMFEEALEVYNEYLKIIIKLTDKVFLSDTRHQATS